MTIDAPCPNCGTIYTVRRELIGKRTKCTRCGAHFVIAEAPTAAPPPPREPAPSPQEAFTGIPTHLPPPAHTASPTTPSPPPRQRADQRTLRLRVQRVSTASLPSDAAGRPRLRNHGRRRPCNRGTPTRGVLRRGNSRAERLACGDAVVRIDVRNRVCHTAAHVLIRGPSHSRLGLQIEQNTRESAQACRQLAEHFSAILNIEQ